MAHGAGALSDGELLSIVLGTGTRGEHVTQMALRMLAEVGGSAGLARADAARLASVRGCGPARAVQIVAGLELGRRSVLALGAERRQILGPEDAAELLGPQLSHLEHERSIVLLLDRRHRLLRQALVGQGGVAHAPLAPREVFAAALREPGTAAVLVAHNHPSGDPEPSTEDRAVTHRLSAAAQVVGIEFLDHVIVAARGWTSMRRDCLGGG
jgi:DNA repair protein RadC